MLILIVRVETFILQYKPKNYVFRFNLIKRIFYLFISFFILQKTIFFCNNFIYLYTLPILPFNPGQQTSLFLFRKFALGQYKLKLNVTNPLMTHLSKNKNHPILIETQKAKDFNNYFFLAMPV